MKLILTYLFFFAMALVGFAATAPSGTPPPLPPGPLLQPIPDFTRWTITQTNGAPAPQGQTGGSQNGAPKPLPPSTIVGERTGDIRHISITYGNGNRIVLWKVGGTQFVSCTGWKVPVVAPASEENIYGNLRWISAKNFDGFVTAAGTNCMVFHDRILPPNSSIARSLAPFEKLAPGVTAITYKAPDPETLKIKAVAYIEVERRIPVALELGNEVTTYKVESINPPVPLTIPPQVIAAIDNQNHQLQATARKAVHP
jgi:hypothetical protein